MGQIIRVNSTYITRLQGMWSVNRQSCYRPPADLNIPIVCTAVVDYDKNQNKTYISGSAGADYDLFQWCCPLDAPDSEPAIRDTKGVYRLDEDCGGPACFLHSEKVALRWEDCLQRRVDEFFNINGTNGGEETDKNVTLSSLKGVMKESVCEYIDYEPLRKTPPLPETRPSQGVSVLRQGGVVSLSKLVLAATSMVIFML
ncbi:hypothetical protein V8F20_006838 [Naviculisporaceae sp. PSN 640]